MEVLKLPRMCLLNMISCVFRNNGYIWTLVPQIWCYPPRVFTLAVQTVVSWILPCSDKVDHVKANLSYGVVRLSIKHKVGTVSSSISCVQIWITDNTYKYCFMYTYHLSAENSEAKSYFWSVISIISQSHYAQHMW